MLDPQKIQKLKATAKAMVAPGKGILAADESTATIEKRFAKINVPSTEDNRRRYREMLFTTPGLNSHISGVILFDETFRQSGSDGRTFVSFLKEVGIMPGIKVDKGLDAMPDSPTEKITKGLDDLEDRLREYAELGAHFAKWRAVITITDTTPTDANIEKNAKDLAAYALACQRAGIVPIVEPEVLMDGVHSLKRCEEVSGKVLEAVFRELEAVGVEMEGIILKPNMVLPAKESGETAHPEHVASATLRIFNKHLPKNLPGVAFLSGGQSEIEATENLHAINKLGPHPWTLSFSYGRALQDSALKTWAGKEENIKAAQEKLLHRAKMKGLAAKGEYDRELDWKE
ncbi:MAG: class I fructose-bisphosphate aldolase [Patescibacteria group bacterium]|jgi:fructose-bisphosphate aldolase class I